MANGAPDPDDFVLLRSGPRSGLKREFAFALKSQSQLPDSVGRTRSGKKRLRLSSQESPLSPPGTHPVARRRGGRGNDGDAVDPILEASAMENGGVMEEDCEMEHSVDVGKEGAPAGEVDGVSWQVEEVNRAKFDQVVIENGLLQKERVDLGRENSSLGGTSVAAEMQLKVENNKPEETTMAVIDSVVSLEAERVNQSTGCSLKKKRANGITAEKTPLVIPVALRRFTRSMLRQPKVVETATPAQTNVAENGILVGNGGNVKCRKEVDGMMQKEETSEAVKGVMSLPEVCYGSERLVDTSNAMEVDRTAEKAGKLPEETVEMTEEFEKVKTDQSAVTEENAVVQEAVRSVVLQDALLDNTTPEVVASGCDRTEMIAQSLDILDEKSVHLSEKVVPETVVVVVENVASVKIDSEDEAPVATVKQECTDEISMETPSPVSSVRLRRFTRSLLKEKEKPKVIEGSSPVCAELLTNNGMMENNGAKVKQETVDVRAKVDVSQLSKASQISWSALMKKLELKMSKKIAIEKCPSNARELLATGLLEGLPVRYLFNSEKKQGLCGTIRDQGILCTCNFCKGTKVITPCQFESHAGSLKKRSVDNIFLDNGTTIREVINACSGTPIDMLEATIRHAISSSPVEQTILLHCKESFISPRNGTCMSVISTRIDPKRYEASSARVIGNRTSLSPESVSAAKSLNSTSKQSSQKKIGHGRITKKDLGLHKLVFSEDALPDGTEVAYYNRGQRLLEGYKQGNGIFCCCCNTEVSPSQFEAHAGWASRRKPYLNIYTSNGVSLHELSLSLSKGRKHSSTDNDDLCSICFDGGDLLLCDICPRAFHKDCVGLTSVPRGKWFCEYCQSMLQREKFVEHNANAMAAGRVLGIDPIEQITKRCIRIVKVKAPEADMSCCVLCKQHHFSKKFGPRTVILCDQCEKEYHVGCLKDHNMGDLKELPEGNWFCCGDCSRIYTFLQKFILDGSEKLPNSLCNLIKTKGAQDVGIGSDCDVRWRLLSGKDAASENRIVLSKAVGIFQERFDPIIDILTGRDLIPSMVYGRSMRDQDFGGMYCAVLTVNSTVVSAGILRIFGQDVAELPLVATSTEHQGQGYFQTLFSCIERLLGSLNVKNLLLPAADEAESIWTHKFGFKKISQDELRDYAKGSHIMSFQGTSMLHKLVPECEAVCI